MKSEFNFPGSSEQRRLRLWSGSTFGACFALLFGFCVWECFSGHSGAVAQTAATSQGNQSAKPAARQEPIYEEEVDRAIQRMKRYLYMVQDRESGGWDAEFSIAGVDRGPANGDFVILRDPDGNIASGSQTALVTYALLASGESLNYEPIGKAIEWLKDAKLDSVYAVAFRAHVWSHLPDAYLPELEKDARWLMAQVGDVTGKRVGREGRYLTNIHYGMLGVWEASKRGIDIPPGYWKAAGAAVAEFQNSDGGWGYRARDKDSYGSMTAAGVASLLIVQQQTGALNAKGIETINKGLTWLDGKFSARANPGKGGFWLYYYLYRLERVGLASGTKRFGDQDWYTQGCRVILGSLASNGSVNGNAVDTALALLFLSRGKVPVWCAGLDPANAAIRRDPGLDLFTRQLSNTMEREFGWVQLRLEPPEGVEIEAWVGAPVLYWSVREGDLLNDREIVHLRSYLDRGGTLLLSGESKGVKAEHVARSLMARVYPQNARVHEPTVVDQEHPLARVYTPLRDDELALVKTFNNGARDLVVCVDTDLNKSLINRQWDSTEYRVMLNLWAWLTDRGNVPLRLPNRREEQDKYQASGSAKVTVARVVDDTGQILEPEAWTLFAKWIAGYQGMTLNIVDVPLKELGASDAKLAHWAGVSSKTLNEEELTAVKSFAVKGGTLLLETVRGGTGFSDGVIEQLGRAMQIVPTQIDMGEPIITGEGLFDGTDLRRCKFRLSTLERYLYAPRPYLKVISQAGRIVVVESSADLTLGILGVEQYGLNGYQPKSARLLLSNIVQYASRLKPNPNRKLRMAQLPPVQVKPSVPTPATQPANTLSAEARQRYDDLLILARQAEELNQTDKSLEAFSAAYALVPDPAVKIKVEQTKRRQEQERRTQALAATAREPSADTPNAGDPITPTGNTTDDDAIIRRGKLIRDGDAHLTAGRFKEAAEAFEAAAKLKDDTVIQGRIRRTKIAELVKQSQDLLTAGKLEEAKAGFDEVLSRDPVNVPGKSGMDSVQKQINYRDLTAAGDKHLASGEFEKAGVIYRKARIIIDTPAIRKKVDQADHAHAISEAKRLVKLKDWVAADASIRAALALEKSEEAQALFEIIQANKPKPLPEVVEKN